MNLGKVAVRQSICLLYVWKRKREEEGETGKTESQPKALVVSAPARDLVDKFEKFPAVGVVVAAAVVAVVVTADVVFVALME